MGELKRQGYAAFAGSLLITSCGMAYAWVSPVLSKLKDTEGDIKATDDQISWIAVILEFGCLLTPFLASYLMDKFGRKKPMLACAPAMVISWILTITTRSVTILYIKRFIDGMVVGIVLTTAPIYLAEIATATTRGAIVISICISWNVGSLLQFCVGTYLSYDTTAWINMIIPILYFIAFYFLPESPYYLVMKNSTEADKSLAWFRDTNPNEVTDELTLIKEYLEKDIQNKTSFSHMMSNAIYKKCFSITIVLTLATTMTGLTTIYSYASDMFAGNNSQGFFNADTCSLAIISQFLLTSVIVSFTIDKLGRRPLMLASGCGCFLSHVGSAFYFYYKDKFDYDWIPLVTIGLYCFFVSVGLSPVFTSFQGELFPSSIKSTASGLCIVVSTFVSIFALKLYYIVNVTFGMHFNYIIYASVSGLTTVWLYFYAPETKNKTFNEIYDELQGGSKKERPIQELQTYTEKT